MEVEDPSSVTDIVSRVQVQSKLVFTVQCLAAELIAFLTMCSGGMYHVDGICIKASNTRMCFFDRSMLARMR
jgi:hypothetical protein